MLAAKVNTWQGTVTQGTDIVTKIVEDLGIPLPSIYAYTIQSDMPMKLRMMPAGDSVTLMGNNPYIVTVGNMAEGIGISGTNSIIVSEVDDEADIIINFYYADSLGV